MVAKFLDHNNREFKQRRRRRQQEQLKSNKFIIIETTTLHVHHAFLYISWPSSQNCDVKLPNFTRLRYGVGKHNTKIFFFFFQTLIRSFRIQPQKILPTFDKSKVNWIRSIKFETVRIHLSEFSVCCLPEILLPSEHDVTTSPLYWPRFCPVPNKCPRRLCES